jgi:tellurite resistance protein
MKESLEASTGLGSLQCSVLLNRRGEPQPTDGLLVEIRGPASVCIPEALLSLWIEDVTGGDPQHPIPVKERSAGVPTAGDRPFRYRAPVARAQFLNASLWSLTIQIDASMLWFARQGKRSLVFCTEVGQAGSTAIAWGQARFGYENPAMGYLDARDRLREAKTLAIPLALAIATADGETLGRELGYVRGWALSDLDLAAVSLKGRRRFEKSLQKLAKLCTRDSGVDLQEVCGQINEKTSLAERYDILEFCVVVAGAAGQVGQGRLSMLKDLTQWLQLEHERFRSLMGKAIPVEAFKVIDASVLLGVRPDMPKADALKQLNHEYAKWNARVTNPDNQVRNQADQMLNLIAQTRNEYTG